MAAEMKMADWLYSLQANSYCNGDIKSNNVRRQNHDMMIVNRCYENVEQFRYLGKTITTKT
jgi:hypothetical protein